MVPKKPLVLPLVKACLMFALFICMNAARAEDPAPDVRYISDETVITLRESKGLAAPVAGLLQAGTRVELLENDTASGYSRVRTQAGREGWVLARYLASEPGARERLAKVEAELARQQELARKLKSENTRLRRADGAGEPTPGEELSGAEQALPGAPTKAIDLATSAGLFIAGLLSGLVASMTFRSRRRQRDDFP